MTTRKTTKRALWMSVLSLLLCIGMLAGTTFAWFTDSVKSENNIITAGSLDIELYWSENAEVWQKVGEGTNIFENDALWEPGKTEVVYLKVVNKGSLALKYRLGVNIADEIDGVNQEGRLFRLSDYIEFGVVKTGDTNFKSKYETREEALAAIEGSQKAISAGYANSSVLYPEKNMPEDVANARFEEYATLVVTMPEDVSNEANHNGINIPKIFLGLNVFATQLTYEKDSYGSDYDIGAPWAGEVDTRWYNTTDNAFVLTTAAQLAGLAEIVNDGIDSFSKKTIYLGADIDLNNLEWEPIGNNATSKNRFSGTFDGDGYTVSNLLITGRKKYVGLFGWAQKEIKNLTVENAKVSGNDHVAAVAGQASGALSNILLTGHVEVSGYRYVGGVAGQGAYSNWNNITVNVVDTDPNVKSYVKSDSVLYDPANPKADENGNYSKEAWTGGVLGHIAGNIVYLTNIASNIDVYGSYDGVGGAFGISNFGNVLEDVTVTGNVFATAAGAECVGGIAGTVENSAQTVTFNRCTFGGKIFDVNGNDITAGNELFGGYFAEGGTGLQFVDGKDLDGNWAVIDNASLVNALTQGGSVKMYKSLTSATNLFVVPQGVTVDLDMNGNKIDGNYDGQTTIITNNGTLTITNGRLETNGVNDNRGNTPPNIINTKGATLTLRDVTLVGGIYGANSNHPKYAIENHGKLTVEEGTSITAHGGGIYTEGEGSVTEINGGTITIPDQKWGIRKELHIHAIYADANSTVTINGGNFTMGNFVNTDKVNPYSYSTVLGAADGDATLGIKGGALTVTGGTFTGVKVTVNQVDINTGDPSDYVADGYWAQKVGDNYVVLNDSTKMVTTADELKDALANGLNVILVANIDLNGTAVSVPAGVTATLDLNGKTISSTALSSDISMFSVANSAKLTIVDNVGTGKITYHSNNSSYNGYIVTLQGELVLESGTLEKTGTWAISYAVDVRPNAWSTAYTADTTFTMNGGKIVCDGSAIRVAYNSSSTHPAKSSSFIMNGGTIEATGDGVFVQQLEATWDVLNVTINGGTIKSTRNPIRIYGPAPTGYVNGEDCITIALSSNATLMYTGDTVYTDWIMDDTIRYGGGATKDQILADTIITIDGVLVVSSSDELQAAVEAGATDIILLSVEFAAIDLYSFKETDGVTIVGMEGATVAGAYNHSQKGADFKNLTFKNITFTAQVSTSNCKIDGITFDYCDFIDGGWLLLTGYNDVALNKATVQNCTFSGSTEKALSVQNPSQNVTILNNTFTNCGTNAIHADMVCGAYLIEGNKINGTGDRAIRFGTKTGAEITIKNNIITDGADSNGEVIKISGDVIAVTAEGNTHNGNAITLEEVNGANVGK